MRKSIRSLAAALAAITAMSCVNVTAFADKLKVVDGVTYKYSDSGEQKGKYTGWAKTSKGRNYYKDGIMLKDQWLRVNGKKAYYLQSDGKAALGTVAIKGKIYSFCAGGNDMGRLISNKISDFDITAEAANVTSKGMELIFKLASDKFQKNDQRVVITNTYRLAHKTKSGWEMLDMIKPSKDVSYDNEEIEKGELMREVSFGQTLPEGRYKMIVEVEVFNRTQCTLTDIRMCHITFTVSR